MYEVEHFGLGQSDASIGQRNPNGGLSPDENNQLGTDTHPEHRTIWIQFTESEKSYFQKVSFEDAKAQGGNTFYWGSWELNYKRILKTCLFTFFDGGDGFFGFLIKLMI